MFTYERITFGHFFHELFAKLTLKRARLLIKNILIPTGIVNYCFRNKKLGQGNSEMKASSIVSPKMRKTTTVTSKRSSQND